VVAPGGKVTITEKPGTYKLMAHFGPSAGATFVLNGFSRMGTISPDGNTIVLTGDVTDVVAFPSLLAPCVTLDVTPATNYSEMICSHSEVLIRKND
jgi:hypothetical protein